MWNPKYEKVQTVERDSCWKGPYNLASLGKQRWKWQKQSRLKLGPRRCEIREQDTKEISARAKNTKFETWEILRKRKENRRTQSQIARRIPSQNVWWYLFWEIGVDAVEISKLKSWTFTVETKVEEWSWCENDWANESTDEYINESPCVKIWRYRAQTLEIGFWKQNWVGLALAFEIILAWKCWSDWVLSKYV